jgi:hypothetical protein
MDKPLSDHTVTELRAIARDYSIKGASYMVKADLVRAIEQATKPARVINRRRKTMGYGL